LWLRWLSPAEAAVPGGAVAPGLAGGIDQSRHAMQLVATALALGAIALPLLLCRVPPLLDYPDHLARAYILQNIGADPVLQQWYRVHWRLMPNLGGDVVMAVLTPFLSVEVAGRILLGLIQATTLAGVALLHRVLWRRWSLWPLAAVPLLWHGALTAGFLNFSLSLGLVPAALALWLAAGDRPLAQRAALGAAAGGVLYLCHLLGFVIFGVMVAGMELQGLLALPPGRRREGVWPRALVLAATAGLPVFAFALYRAGGTPVELLGPWSVTPRLRGLVMPFMGAETGARLALLLAFAGVLGILSAARALRFAMVLAPGLLVLVLGFLLLPGTVLDNGHVPDRLPVAVALLLVAGTDAALRGAALRRLAAAVVAGCVLLQTVSVARQWHLADQWLDGFHRALDRLPAGSRLLVATPWAAEAHGDLFKRHSAVPGWYLSIVSKHSLAHMASLAVTRGAFVPVLFADPNKQILALTPPVRRLAFDPPRPAGVDEMLPADSAAGPRLAGGYAEFDHVLVLYADLLTPAQRSRLAALRSLYDDGRIMLIENRR
jgi:hypothetical protein